MRLLCEGRFVGFGEMKVVFGEMKNSVNNKFRLHKNVDSRFLCFWNKHDTHVDTANTIL